MIRKISFGKKNSLDDFDARIISSEESELQKRETLIQIPYMDGSIDESALNGRYYYNNITVTYVLFLAENSQSELYRKITEIRNWLLQTQRQCLYDSDLFDYHYIGKCINVSVNADYDYNTAEITAVFRCDPYKYSIDFSNVEWDAFNFNTDYLNLTELQCTAVPIGNHVLPSILNFYSYATHDIIPKLSYIKSSKDTQKVGLTMINLNGEIISNSFYRPYDFDFKIDDFVVKPGVNVLALYGYGTLRLTLTEEVL